MSAVEEAITEPVTDLSHLPTENLVPRCPAESSEDSESSSSSSSSSSEDDCSDVESVVSSEIEIDKLPKLKTKGELTLEDLPPIENLEISVPEEECQVIGHILNSVETLVLVKAIPNLPPVDIDSVLFLDKGDCVLGQVFDVIGPVSEPIYCIRFNSKEYISELSFNPGDPVYYAPTLDYTHYVFLPDLLKMKGSDASWQNNHEPPPNLLDYSDDEQERQAKRKLMAKRQWENRQKVQNEEEVSVIESTGNTDSEKDPLDGMRTGKSSARRKAARRRRFQKNGDTEKNCAPVNDSNQSQDSRKSESNGDVEEENLKKQNFNQSCGQNLDFAHSRQNTPGRKQTNQSNFHSTHDQDNQQMNSNFPATRNPFDLSKHQFSPNPGNSNSSNNPVNFSSHPQSNNAIASNPFSSSKPSMSSNFMSPTNFLSSPVNFPPPPNFCGPPNLPNSSINFPPSSLNPPNNPGNFPPLDTSKPPPQFPVPPIISAPTGVPPSSGPNLPLPPPSFLPSPVNMPAFGQPPPFPFRPLIQGPNGPPTSLSERPPCFNFQQP
nr:PREDICTED: H/ACA ribonucleoprotein complex non-core subunit NAF1 [Bemisia tabaci]